MDIVLKKLDTIKENPSRNEKIMLLSSYLTDPLFAKVVHYAMDGLAHYNIKKMPKAKRHSKDEELSEDRYTLFFKCLDTLKSKLGASQQVKQNFADLCGNGPWWEIAQRIVKKDLRCGIQAKTVNAAWPNFINIIPYQRCSSITHHTNVTYPAYVQKKADGTFGYFVNSEQPKFLSRNGREFHFKGDILDKIRNELGPGLNGFVLMGELLITDEVGLPLDRKTGNGILNKALKKTISLDDSENVIYEVWDAVPEKYFWNIIKKYKVSYEGRRHHLKQNISELSEITTFIWEKRVNSLEETKEVVALLMDAGEEGGILKDRSAKWCNGTSRKQIKFKAEKECELQISDVFFGDDGTKFENAIGRLECISADKKLKVYVGSGLSDVQRGITKFVNAEPVVRKDITDYMQSLIGEIVTVRFNEVITNKKDKTYTLYLPRIIEFRGDKNEADTLKYIQSLK